METVSLKCVYIEYFVCSVNRFMVVYVIVRPARYRKWFVENFRMFYMR
jgi:hypothetical protein